MEDIQKRTECLDKELTEQNNILKTERLDLSMGELISMYENHELIIRPAFQRYFRWSEEQQTRFIESLLLGIPIPPIFVATNSEGAWELVDGLQRVSTFLSFVGVLQLDAGINVQNGWELLEGERVKSIEGFTFKTLPQKYRFALRHSVIRVEILKWTSNYDMRYELFNRLNTSGSPLTQQEIRNCIFRDISPVFNDNLKEWVKISSFVASVNLSREMIERLFDEELLLRFMSLLDGAKAIKSSVSQHMTRFMEKALNNKDFDYDSYKTIITRTFTVLQPLGPSIYRQPDGAFATSLFDVITYGIAKNIDVYEKKSSEEIKSIIETKVRKDENFIRFSRKGGNNQKKRIQNRLKVAEDIFGNGHNNPKI